MIVTPDLIEFIEKADVISKPVVCCEDDNGKLTVIERHLVIVQRCITAPKVQTVEDVLDGIRQAHKNPVLVVASPISTSMSLQECKNAVRTALGTKNRVRQILW